MKIKITDISPEEWKALGFAGYTAPFHIGEATARIVSGSMRNDIRIRHDPAEGSVDIEDSDRTPNAGAGSRGGSMKFDEDQHRYLLDSGRSFYAHMDALSVWDGKLVSGFDDEVPARLDDPEELTPEERSEIAQHMIARWLVWAAAMPAGCTLHPVAMETCEMCPRVDLHLKVDLTNEAVRRLMAAAK